MVEREPTWCLVVEVVDQSGAPPMPSHALLVPARAHRTLVAPLQQYPVTPFHLATRICARMERS
ncbi:hypothetical protein [Streptomyces sp. LUP47B]|uniref:hypothetical protein n=1 Tax=Streptomyces sp. LUP47B TaxID=1890286 RepID=UPI000851896A|nr:hypothetical protein [Streptomyces sp. LUP47B]